MILTKRLEVGRCTHFDHNCKKRMEDDHSLYQFAIGNAIDYNEEIYKKYEFSARHKDKGFFVGYCKGYISVLNPKVFWLQTLMIDRPYLRKGYGTEIVQALEEGMKARGVISQVHLSVVFNNYSAKKFWTKQGYSIYRTLEKNVFGDHKVTVCIYRKTL